MMLYEHKLDCKTRGLVCGDALIFAKDAVVAPIVKRRNYFVIWDAVPIKYAPVTTHYKVVVRSRETHEEIWVRPFATKQEALFCYLSLTGLDMDRSKKPIYLPTIWQDGDLEYAFATVNTFNATTTDNTKTWPNNGTLVPTGVTKTDYLVIGGGAGGGKVLGGGGGAGGMVSATNFNVTPGNSTTITVGAKGTGSTSTTAGQTGAAGGQSNFAGNTADGGGGGASQNTANGANGGSGGGASGPNSGIGGTATSGQGNNGGDAYSAVPYAPGGGGGKGTVGVNGTSSSGGNGGDGSASTISGSSVTYAAGGGGSGDQFRGLPVGIGGSSGLAPSGTQGDTVPTAAASNKGLGGGGSGFNGGTPANGGDGGSGVIILSYTAASVVFFGNSPMLGM